MDFSWEEALEKKITLEEAKAKGLLCTIDHQKSCVVGEKEGVPVFAVFNYLIPKCRVGMRCGYLGRCGNSGGDYCESRDYNIDYGGYYETAYMKEALLVWRLDDKALKNLYKNGFRALDEIPKNTVSVFRLPWQCVEYGRERMLLNNIRKILETNFGGEFDTLFWIPCWSGIF